MTFRTRQPRNRATIVAYIGLAAAIITLLAAIIGFYGNNAKDIIINNEPVIDIDNRTSEERDKVGEIEPVLIEDNENSLCASMKRRSKDFSEKIKAIIDTSENSRERINLLFWRDKFDSYSNYDCKILQNKENIIYQSFEKASKQLKLHEIY